MHERTLYQDFITEAVKHGAGLDEDCYELSVLGMFRREYIGALDDGETVLWQYAEKALQITQAIDELTGEDSQKVWECVYTAGIVPAVLLITSGKWDEAYALCRSMCEELFEVFVAGHLQDYDPERWVEAWIQAKLEETPVEALDTAARGGVVPLEEVRPVRRAGVAGAL